MAARISIPPPPWENETDDKQSVSATIPAPPWESSAKSDIPAPPWEATSMEEPVSFADRAARGVKSLAEGMAKLPMLPGQKIAEVSRRGHELEAQARTGIENYVSDPSNGSDLKRAAVGTLADLALEFVPPTPEGQLANAAIAEGMGFAGKAGLKLVSSKFPAILSVLTKERAVPAAISDAIGSLGRALGITESKAVTPEALRAGIESGRVAPQTIERLESAIKAPAPVPEPASAPVKPTSGRFEPTPEQKNIFHQDPATGDTFYEAVKIDPAKLESSAPKLVEITKIGNDITALNDIAGARGAPKSAALAAKTETGIAKSRAELIDFATKNLPEKPAAFYEEIKTAEPARLQRMAREVTNEFRKSVAAAEQPVAPTIQPRKDMGVLFKDGPKPELPKNKKTQALESALTKNFDNDLKKYIKNAEVAYKSDFQELKERYRLKIEAAEPPKMNAAAEKRIVDQIGEKNFGFYREDQRLQEVDRLTAEYKDKLQWLGKKRDSAIKKATDSINTQKTALQEKINKVYPSGIQPGGQGAPVGQIKLPEVQGLGKTKPRGLSEGVEAKSIAEGLTKGFGDLPEYRTVNMQEQAAHANYLLNTDYERAKRIAMGTERAPKDVIPESLFVAVENKAIRDGDVATLRELATTSRLTQEATTMGQRIRTLAERNPDSPAGAMADISKIREEMAIKRLKAKDLTVEKTKIASEIENVIRRTSPKKETWISFVESLRC